MPTRRGSLAGDCTHIQRTATTVPIDLIFFIFVDLGRKTDESGIYSPIDSTSDLGRGAWNLRKTLSSRIICFNQTATRPRSGKVRIGGENQGLRSQVDILA
jgi:hypothetical protein